MRWGKCETFDYSSTSSTPSMRKRCSTALALTWLAFLLGFPRTSSAASAARAFPTPGNRVVYGQPADDVKYPFFVRLFVLERDGFGESVCGGSLIEPRVVLTAAHCVGDATESVRVYHPTSDRQAYAVSYQLHPLFDRRTLDGDLALLRLSFALAPDEMIARAKGLRDWHGVPLTVIGYGLYEVGTLSDVLREGHLVGMSGETCLAHWSPDAVRKDRCAAGESGEVDSCNGDSGGPIVLRNDVFRIVGIVSRGSSDCGSMPGIYTDLYHYFNASSTTFLTTSQTFASAAYSSILLLSPLVIALGSQLYA